MIKNLTYLIICISFSASAQVIKFENVKVDEGVRMKIVEELSKYPKDLLSNYLTEIIIQDLPNNVCGRSEAFSKRIRLNASCYTPIQETLHHELSSVFLQQYDVYVSRGYFNKLYSQFVNLNENVKYDKSVALHKIDAESDLANYFYKLTYAQTGFENDFNVISQFLFTHGASVVEYMQNHPNKPVAKKIQLVIDFYHDLNSQFTLNYFKKL